MSQRELGVNSNNYVVQKHAKLRGTGGGGGGDHE